MSKQEMMDYITDKLENADYLFIEIVYGLMLGLTGEDIKT